MTRFPILIFPIDCCVRIKGTSLTRLLNDDIQSLIDFLIVTASVSKLLHSWLFIDPSEHHYTTQTSKYKLFWNQFSIMFITLCLPRTTPPPPCVPHYFGAPFGSKVSTCCIFLPVHRMEPPPQKKKKANLITHAQSANQKQW